MEKMRRRPDQLRSYASAHIPAVVSELVLHFSLASQGHSASVEKKCPILIDTLTE